ncbi:MAG: hypothetical protein RLZZ07_807 [Actinomycetota bacterium]
MHALNYPLVMGKRLSLVITTILTASLCVIPAHSAVKAGSPCKKFGSISLTSTKKFTCVRSGTKLVWNKGVTLSKQTSQPIPEPTKSVFASPSPVPQERPKEMPRVERVEAVGIDSLNPKSVYDRSRQEVNDAIGKSNYVNTYLNFNIGPNQSPSVIASEKDSLSKAAKLWSNVYQPKEQLEVLFYDFTDLDWAKAKYTQFAGAETFRSAASCSKAYCGNATAGRSGKGPWIYEQGLGGSLWNKSTSAHEYTHLAQTSGNAEYWNIAPLWLVEGMAQFYGEAIGYFPFDANLVTRGEMHRQYSSDFKNANLGEMKTLLQKNSASTVKNLMQSIEFPNPRHTQALTAAAYLLGSYGSEVLVAVYGHSSVERFIKSFANSSDWKINFFNSFGIAVDDFYTKLTPYLHEISKEL